MYNFISITALFFFSLAAFLLTFIGKLKLTAFFLSVLSFLLTIFLFRMLRARLFHSFRAGIDGSEEKINLLFEEVKEKTKTLNSLTPRAEKVSFLFDVSCGLIELIEPEAILDSLIKTCAELFTRADNVLLFTLQKDSLSLTRSIKRKGGQIFEKHGDIIEKWVIKHMQSLVVEDLTKDFRFDSNKVIAFKERRMRSFVASPLAIGETVVGALRIEAKNPALFFLDDSRMLRSICDLGAVVYERAQLFKKAEELATRDSLTSLFLRQFFFGRLKEEARRASLTKTGLGLIMLDIDDFKKINDTYGHTVGDLVLKRLAGLLSEMLGNTGNAICRFGGEEFMVYLVGCSRANLYETAEKIRSLIAGTEVRFRRKVVHFTVSAGAALYPDDSHDILDLVSIADQVLYKAKKEGKNRVCYFGR